MNNVQALKQLLIELGTKEPDLQGHLRVILDHLCGKAQNTPDAPPIPEQVESSEPLNDRPLSVPERQEGQFFNLSPDTMRAFNQVILPQIQAKLDAASFEDLNQMMEEMEGLGKSQNIELENALIVFKPISMNTKRFWKEIQEVFYNWLRPRLKLNAPEPEQAKDTNEGGTKEFNFVFK